MVQTIIHLEGTISVVLTWSNFVSLKIFGNVWRHFWLSNPGAAGVAVAICSYQVDSSDTTHHPTMHRVAPYSKEIWGPFDLVVLWSRKCGLAYSEKGSAVGVENWRILFCFLCHWKTCAT